VRLSETMEKDGALRDRLAAMDRRSSEMAEVAAN
jgi:hypothetical protein